MATVIEEIDSFAEFVRRAANNEKVVPSLEECLRLWREERERAETIADIKASLAEIEAGNYTTIEEADRIIRSELGWPPRKA